MVCSRPTRLRVRDEWHSGEFSEISAAANIPGMAALVFVIRAGEKSNRGMAGLHGSSRISISACMRSQGDSRSRLSLPGYRTAQTSTPGGNRSAHRLYTDAPAPAWGKQISRRLVTPPFVQRSTQSVFASSRFIPCPKPVAVLNSHAICDTRTGRRIDVPAPHDIDGFR